MIYDFYLKDEVLYGGFSISPCRMVPVLYMYKYHSKNNEYCIFFYYIFVIKITLHVAILVIDQ